MSLKQKVETEIKSAMIAKNKVRLTALRAIKSLILLEETKEGYSGSLSEDDELKLLTKAAKQRKDSAEIYEKQGRNDLLETELAELEVIQEFLPKALTDEELGLAVQEIINVTGAVGPKDMGKVMGVASKQLAGKADGKAIAEKVKMLLNG
ncbi:MAG: GatB/YqeY domain-containing protein [Cytophagales bacterium]|uniref:GatB/YqeY domain-containing protein n=1 Tax=Algoriphagus taiwanensis TaxID=1445656 RepID=A0ABQ6Q649_9BACT|nr:MAG: GatB/YqeY domain-containing protein [Cytophagales bacterium]GMQ35651.1 GatB/YqeY domain-containing protein [Algoriphagus taiwanensis]